MGTVLITVLVLAAVVIGAILILRRGAGGAAAAAGELQASPGSGEREASMGVEARVEERGLEREAAEPAEVAEATEVGGEGGEGAGPVEGGVEAPPSEDELRARLEARLADSSRMLGELKAITSDGGEEPVAGSVGIIEEGLEEVRALAERAEWGQARDKCEALHAQLSLLLQGARREQAS